MPERGVLITRPEPEASATARLIAARDFHPIIAPLLHITRRSPSLPDPARLQAILVTSGNALPGLAPTHLSVSLFAVGDATAERARALGFRAVTSAHGDGAALAALALAQLSPRAGPLLLAAGAHRGDALASTLRAAGFTVARRVLYEAAPVAELPARAAVALRAESLVAALFFSGATAATFARLATEAGLAPTLRAVDALAIGERAAAVLRPLPFRAVRVALRPTQDALLGMLA